VEQKVGEDQVCEQFVSVIVEDEVDLFSSGVQAQNTEEQHGQEEFNSYLRRVARVGG
jgi:phosphosulfolactate synthase (CoM biosynthesis protein A)